MRTIGFAIAALALAVAGCFTTPSLRPHATGPESPRASEPVATDAATPLTFDDGTHRVGTDVEPGTYRAIREATSNLEDFCYWERVSGFDGSDAELIANAAGVGPRVVTIAPDDVGFVSENCGTWSSAITPLSRPIADGVWIVGVDLQPGRYVAEAGAACVWQRLSAFGGTADESLEVGLSGTVVIEPADRGFSSSNCGSWALDR